MIDTINRRRFLKLMGSGATALAAQQFLVGCSRTPATKPNILFMMSDDHAANAVSCYGSRLAEIAPTQNIDRIASEGVRLNNCFATNSLCAPSRASILTGQYSHVHQVYGLQAIDPSLQTFPQLLQQSGYQTAIFGKWHLHTDPVGFDDWAIFPMSTKSADGQGRYYDPEIRERGKYEPIVDIHDRRTDVPWEGKVYEGQYVTDVVGDLCLDWLEKRRNDKPFFLMCHFKAAHGPFEFNKKYADLFEDVIIPEPPTLFDDLESRSPELKTFWGQIENLVKWLDRQDRPTWHVDTDGMTEEEKIRTAYQQYLKHYLRCVASIDENVGRLLDYLENNDLLDNTVVIYTSDQGMFLGEHGFVDKRMMLEEAIRMPFVVRYPSEIQPAQVSDDIVTNVDFAETFLDYGGVQIPENMQGRSFRAVLRGNTPGDWPKSMFYAYYGGRPRCYGVRTKQYKLIHYTGQGSRELYDLRKDPLEINNFYKEPEYKEIARSMEAELQRLIMDLNVDPLPKGD